ncbi:MAG: methionyl-tRNA formyltransferase [Chloroflexi bacterium]|nr:MAG: methionyl-tRNA formyltransferase [Chloroflexota bacterium]
MKIVFMGTPYFAIPVLDKISANGHDIVAVYTQPDRTSGRGRKITMSAVKKHAISKNFQVLQPGNFRGEPSQVHTLDNFKADIAVVAAYGTLLPSEILGMFPHGCINLHPSLLPKYRGASPVSTAILESEKVTGITIMQLDSGMDSGPILAQKETPIGEEDLCNELTEKLFYIGSDLIVETISKLAKGTIVSRQQNHENATYTKKLVRKDGLVDWKEGAEVIWKKIRAHHPWPGSYTHFNGGNLKIIEARISENYKSPPGCVSIHGNAVYVGTSDGSLLLSQIQSEGSKITSATDFARGHRDFENSILS